MPHVRSLAISPAEHIAGTRQLMARPGAADIELVGVVVAVIDDQPLVRVITDGRTERLPSALYRCDGGDSLERALRKAVAKETSLELGFVEQLNATAVQSTAGSVGRVSIGYLTLAHGAEADAGTTGWASWYAFFPWEDWRNGRPQILREMIEPRLRAFAEADETPDGAGLSRLERVRMSFGLDGIAWDEERVVERYDLLDQSGLLEANIGRSLPGEQRRTLAVAIARLRSRIKSRPVVFELMPELFTLFELQLTVEAILGPHLHKQNFRRLVEQMGLVEPTDGMKSHTGGRPAKLFRFRQSVVLERLQPGVRVRTARA
jgi:hypothetical protein